MKTEHTILRAVDHPFLAKMYATLQTGEGKPRESGAVCQQRGLSSLGRTTHSCSSQPASAHTPPPPAPVILNGWDSTANDRTPAFLHARALPAADTHVHFLLEYCSDGMLFDVLERWGPDTGSRLF